MPTQQVVKHDDVALFTRATPHEIAESWLFFPCDSAN